MIPLDLDALEQKARAATAGPYVVEHDRNGQPNIYPRDDHDRWIALLPHQCVTSIERQANADAEYFAAASPDVVLALVERLRAAEVLVRNGTALRGEILSACDADGEKDDPLQTVRGLVTRADAAESRATRAEAQRDRLAEALRKIVAGHFGVRTTPEHATSLGIARAALAEVDDGVVGGGG